MSADAPQEKDLSNPPPIPDAHGGLDSRLSTAQLILRNGKSVDEDCSRAVAAARNQLATLAADCERLQQENAALKGLGIDHVGITNELQTIQLLAREKTQERPDSWKQAAQRLAVATTEHITNLNNALGTEQTMHAAWEKRAYHSEAQLIASQQEVTRLTATIKEHYSARPTEEIVAVMRWLVSIEPTEHLHESLAAQQVIDGMQASLSTLTAALTTLRDEMRAMQIVAGQCSVEEGDGVPALMAAAESERCGKWADTLTHLLTGETK